MIQLQAPSQMIANDENLQVLRTAKVAYVDGKPNPGNIEKLNIKCTVQPLSGKDLLIVPEGDRFKEQYWLWTTCEVLDNDQVVRCGKNYQVQTVQIWGSFRQVRIMRIDVGPNISTG